jgi:transcriptional regulator with XRE-family HTH domain
MSQVELAEAIGVNQRTVSYYENEGGNPELAILGKIATTLGTTLDQLVGIDELRSEGPQPETVNEERLWKRFKKLVKLPERDRRAVLRMCAGSAETGKYPSWRSE